MADPIEILDAYLSSDAADENSMGISDLDGFLTGVICSPDPIDSSVWLPVCMGDVSRVPDFVLEAVHKLYREIQDALAAQNTIEPIFWQAKDGHVIAMDWCEGFLDAVKLRPDAWQAFIGTQNGAELMTPILVHMVDDQGNSMWHPSRRT